MLSKYLIGLVGLGTVAGGVTVTTIALGYGKQSQVNKDEKNEAQENQNKEKEQLEEERAKVSEVDEEDPIQENSDDSIVQRPSR